MFAFQGMSARLRLLFLGSALLACPAFSQAPAPIVRIERIVVAEHVLTADANGRTQLHLEDTTPTSAQTLATATPRLSGLTLHDGGAGSFGSLLALRGLANTPYFSEPAVSLAYDDIPLGSAFSYPTGLAGLSSITLQRGTQGSSGGLGGEAGSLTLHSHEPGPVAAGELRLGLGDYALRSAALRATSARAADGDATVALSSHQRDGYLRNATLGRTVDDQEHTAFATRLRVRPTRDLELSLQVLGLRQRDGAQPLVPLGGSTDQVARGREGVTNTDLLGAALKAVWTTRQGVFTATSSRTEWRLAPYENRLVLPPTLDSHLDQSQRAWNQELRVDSDSKSIVLWHSGLWFSHRDTDGNVNRAIPGLYPVEISNFALRSQTAAWFAEATAPLDLGWTLTAGLRAETVQRDFERAQRVPSVARFTAARSFDSLQPKISTSYALTNDTTASATLGLAGRPGGWSAYTANASLAAFGAERTTSLETGIDTRFDDRNATLAARIFASDIRGYQIERSFSAADYLVATAPHARSLGAELEGNWRATPHLTLTATFAATEVTLRRFTDPLTGRDLSGHRAPFTPRWTAFLAATQQLPLGCFVGAEVATVGRTSFDERGDAAFTTAARTTTAMSLGWTHAAWRLVARGENLADDRHAMLIIPGVRHAVPAAPRRFSCELTRRW